MSSVTDQLDKAIATASNWAVTGWSMTFGNRHVAVNSLQEAKDLENSFPNRLEALSYWKDVDTVGKETASHGEKAKDALANGDIGAAKNSIYLASYMEKRINDKSPTWGPVLLALDE
ncbi:MAG: hypothetical protein HQL70_09285 [Magnetococcales bacterium]|nr:hypothetical protein [Magnetococcales bacterium]